MATVRTPMQEFETTAQDMRMEIFGLVWADTNSDSQEGRNIEQKLRSIINNLKKFDNGEECVKYIENTSKNDRIILIVSGQIGQSLVPRVFKLRQVISIYVFCSNKDFHKQWAANYTKVKAVLTKLNTLVNRIKEDHKNQKVVEEPLAVSFFSVGKDVDKSTNALNGKFVFLQVLIECLLKLKPTQTDKDELIETCKSTYEDNQGELQNICEFQQAYSVNKALWWYTRDSFFYKTLNAVLRTENICMIVLFRSYIYDIQEQLKKYQAESKVTVYRGQMISNNELEALKYTTGQFISVNSFFSTTSNYKQALLFLNDRENADNLQRVIFEVKADPKMAKEKPFANISNCSEFPDEEEILFMLGSIFRLNSIDHNEKDNVSIIRMTLCSESEHEVKQVLTYMKHQLIGDGETNLRILGKVLWKMGKLDLAEQYFLRQLKHMKQDDPLLGSLYEDLGEVTSQKGDLDNSVKWHKKAMEIKRSEEPNEKVTTKTSNKPEKRPSSSYPSSGNSIIDMLNSLYNQSSSLGYEDSVKSCYGCGEPITSHWKTFGNRDYHPDCVKCTHCDAVLKHQKGVYNHNSELYCDACSDSLFAEKCVKCKKPIRKGMTYGGQPYHEECFRCTQCNKLLKYEDRIGGTSLEPYCATCTEALFAKRCTKCKKPIPFNTNYSIVEGQPYHRHCFVCVKCNQCLASKTYYLHHGGFTCKYCNDT